jgi:sterol desaturase/sphingolipid hydroxylase (fatty acid hydroxylase superfamily)
MRAEHLIAVFIPLTYLLIVVLEQRVPNRRWPSIKDWQLTGIGFFIMLGIVNNAVSIVANNIFPNISLFDGSRLGSITGAFLGYVLLSLGNALIHRAYHRYDFLWRYVHQLHHAPQRLDVAGVMFQTPFEALASALLFVFVAVFLLGLDPVASMLCAYIAAFYGMFQHMNIRTPVWLGYWIQRPEAHSLHHERGLHRDNYSDLPIWDMVLGSFNNPEKFEGELGFEAGLQENIWPMLLGRTVNAQREKSPVDQ